MAEPEFIAAPREDRWANTPEVRRRLRQMVEAANAGYSYRLSEEFLLKLMDSVEGAGGSLTRESLDRLLEDVVQAGEIERVSTPTVTRQAG